MHLAVGLATMPSEPLDVQAPVLLRPLVIRRRGRDFELQLQGKSFVNPALSRLLRDDFGVELDEEHRASLADDGGGFSPNPVLDSLRLSAAHVPGFDLSPRVLVSVFAEIATPTARRPDVGLASCPLDAVAGDQIAVSRLRDARTEPDYVPQD